MQYGASNDSGTSTTVLTGIATSTIIVNNTAPGNGIIGQSTGSGIGVLGQVSQTLSSADGVHANTTRLRHGDEGQRRCARYLPGSVDGSVERVHRSPGRRTGLRLDDQRVVGLRECRLAGCVAQGRWPRHGRRLPRHLPAAPTTAASLPASWPPASTLHCQRGEQDRQHRRSGDRQHRADRRTAVTYNITVTSTVATGYLAVEGNNTTVSASTINWFGAGQTLANAATVKLNDARVIAVICGGTGATTHFIVDVTGYYL